MLGRKLVTEIWNPLGAQIAQAREGIQACTQALLAPDAIGPVGPTALDHFSKKILPVTALEPR